MSYHCCSARASGQFQESLPRVQPQGFSCVYPSRKDEKPGKDFKLSKKPFLDKLETDRLMGIRIGMENRAHEQKIFDNAKLKMRETFAVATIDLENRRDKLKTLVENELECYHQEIIDKYETDTALKIDEMREKVKKLRGEREIQQKKIVEEKLDQVFRLGSDEMRKRMSDRLNQIITEDWNEQLNQKRRLDFEVQEEERLWACINLMDMEEKLKREEASRTRQIDFNKKALEQMNNQLELKKLKKANLAKIVEKEREMIQADLAAVISENKRLLEEKWKKQQIAKEHVKEMLETRNYYRDRRLKREEIVAQEFLKKAVRELYLEQEDRDKRKKDLMRAITIYRDYLRKWNCLENGREEVLQRLIDRAIEEQYDKTMASRRREVEQRRTLFESVQAGRKLQIEDLKRKKEFEEIEQQKEIEMLKDEWKKYLVEIEEEKYETKRKSENYKSDLDCQVAYNNLLKDRETAEDERQNELGEIEEKLFNNRLQRTLQEASVSKKNPFREPFIGKPVRQAWCPV